MNDGFQLLQVQLPSDHDAFAFAADSWLRSYRAACMGGEDHAPPTDMAQYLLRRLPTQQYFEHLRPHVQRNLRAGFLLATLGDDEDAYQGFAVHHGGTLHYIYVKKWARRLGLGTLMLKNVGPLSYCTRSWPWVDGWMARNRIEYRPQEAFRDPRTA